MSTTSAFKIGVAVVAAAVLAGGGYFAGLSRHEHPSSTTTSSKKAGDSAEQLWTCSMHPQVIQNSPGVCPICHMELVPLKKQGQGGDGVIQIDPAIVQNMGVRTAVVVKGPLVRAVRVVGYLEEPEPFHRDINLRVNGWIEKLYADTDGMVVTKGMPLFDLYSPELTVAIDELISARKQSATDATSKALYESSQRKLLQLGLDETQVEKLAKLDAAPRTVPILGTLDGHLTAKMVYEGAAVKAGDLVLRLASRHRMWIDAQVYEQQMSLISNGQPARITMVSQPGTVIEGKVLFVHPHVDPQTRTALARIEIPNEDLSLRQGMYATVEILADSYAEATLLPREAVIDTGRKQFAFVSLGDGKFQPRALTLGGAGQDGTVEIKAGVSPGEVVVTSGQFLLDSESRVREAIAKFGAGPQASTAPPQQTRVAISSPAAKVNVPHASDMLDAYLVLAEQLGKREDERSTPLDPALLIDKSAVATEHATGDAKPLADRVRNAAAALSGKSLAEQRKAFVELSNAVVAVAKAAPASRKLYRFHCPMAFSDEGADWLQANKDLSNPYYAKEMKACGTLEETIEPQR